jgi:hypothetical protein
MSLRSIKQRSLTIFVVGFLLISGIFVTITNVNAIQIWGELSGTVTDAGTGDPIYGVTITATADVISDPYDSGTNTTDTSGEYIIEELNGNHPVGKSYTVTAEKAGYVTQEVNGVLIYSADDGPAVVTIQDFQLQRKPVNAVYGTTPELDGTISEGEWDDAETPDFYSDIPVSFKRNCSHLHVLFIWDMSDGPPSGHEDDYKDYDGTGIIFDLDNDEGSDPDTDDILLRVYLNGSLREMQGTGSGWGYVTVTGWTAFTGWSQFGDPVVEYSIPYSKIGVTSGVAKTLGMSFGRYRLDRMGELYSVWWPKVQADPEIPDTWGEIVFPPKPIIESCDSMGVTKNIFNPGEQLYVKASGYEPGSWVLWTVTKDLTWVDKMDIPVLFEENHIWGPGGSIANEVGEIFLPTAVFPLDLVPGEYDIVVDVNDNGVYDECIDALDDFDVETAGFFVIPELPFGTVLALATCLLALVIYRTRRKNM